MRSSITISGKQIVAAIARQIRTVMSIALKHGLALRLDAWFLLKRLAGTAMAQRVAVPVHRRCEVVGVTRPAPAQMRYLHLRRVTGHSAGPGSRNVGGGF
jgi:hypothetical protein